MNHNLLHPSEMLSPGDDLWVFSGFDTSNVLKKMDWYLNFLFFNSNFKDKTKPTLVSAEGKLPTKLVLSLTYKGDINQWSDEIKSICKKLGKPKLRVFLPANFNNPKGFEFDFECPTNLVIE